MNNNDYDFSNEKTRQLDSQNERTITTNTIVVTLMRNVYMWMALALVIYQYLSTIILIIIPPIGQMCKYFHRKIPNRVVGDNFMRLV